ncbi:MAG: thioredoxin domain-containing protein, partial [Gemmatimonadota bacterium]
PVMELVRRRLSGQPGPADWGELHRYLAHDVGLTGPLANLFLMLYLHQEVWAPLENPGPFLLSLGDSLRLTRSTLASCLEKKETREEVRQDSQGASRAGAKSTPTFWIEGGMMTGAHPTAVFRQVLDSIYLAKTRKP